MARGRKPKSREQRVREGNAGKRPLPEPVHVGERLSPDVAIADSGELVERIEIPAMPEHLALGDELDDSTEARDLWEGVCTLLIREGIVVEGDLFVLASLIESILLARKAWWEMRSAGSMVVETANDRGGRASSKPSPWLKVHRDATQTMLKIAEHYALTPVARARLGLTVGRGKQIWEELEKGLPENPLDRRGDSDDDDFIIDYEGEAK